MYIHFYLALQNYYFTKSYFCVWTTSSVSKREGFNLFLEWLLSVFANELFFSTVTDYQVTGFVSVIAKLNKQMHRSIAR